MSTLIKPTLHLFAMLLFFAACTSSTIDDEKKENDETRESVVRNFIDNITSLESIEAKSEIAAFVEEATAIADRVMDLNKKNMPLVLEKAKYYKALVIIVENHTIVKITDLEDCKPSGAWDTCMPLGEGYIKKGALIKKKDYINNIIGTSADMKRTAYLFN